MQIGGTLVNAVVRIAILAATLALVYFFIIRPILDTTDRAFTSANEFSDSISKQVQNSIDQANESLSTGNGQAPRKTRRLQREIRKVPTSRLSRLNPCVTRVSPDIDKMIRCAKRLQ